MDKISASQTRGLQLTQSEALLLSILLSNERLVRMSSTPLHHELDTSFTGKLSFDYDVVSAPPGHAVARPVANLQTLNYHVKNRSL